MAKIKLITAEVETEFGSIKQEFGIKPIGKGRSTGPTSWEIDFTVKPVPHRPGECPRLHPGGFCMFGYMTQQRVSARYLPAERNEQED